MPGIHEHDRLEFERSGKDFRKSRSQQERRWRFALFRSWLLANLTPPPINQTSDHPGRKPYTITLTYNFWSAADYKLLHEVKAKLDEPDIDTEAGYACK